MSGNHRSVLVIASRSSDLSRCAATLSKFSEMDCQVHILMVGARISKKEKPSTGMRDYKAHAIQDFNFDEPTQENVNSLRTIIDDLQPSLAIIPSINTLDQKLGVLARSALLACRSIANVLMYDRPRSSSPNPPVFFLIETGDLKGNNKNNKMRSRLGNNKRLVVEAFESQRIILLGDIFK